MSAKSTLDLNALKTNKNIAARSYWKRRLLDFSCSPYFRYDRAGERSSTETKYRECSFTSSEEISRVLKGIAGSERARHVVLLSTLMIVAQKYSSEEDVCIFSPAYPGSTMDNTGQQIIPVRMNNFSGISFRRFLMEVKDNLIGDLAHANYPVEKSVQAGGLNLNNISVTGMLLEEIGNAPAFDRFAPGILFSFSVDDCITLRIRYNPDSYDPGYITLLPGLYFSLLQRLIGNKDIDIGDIALISEQEEHRILHVFNNTNRSYPEEESVIGLFEAQVDKTPGQIAIGFDHEEMSFYRLNTEVNRLAHFLLTRGVKNGEPVAILLERSPYFVIAVLAVLKAGCVYLPVDPDHPEERIRYILDDSHAGFLLTREGLLSEKGINVPVGVSRIDMDGPDIKEYPTLNPGRVGNGNIYIIYTSGSTGQPKGVVGTQTGLLNRLYWGWETFPYETDEVCCLKTNLGFVDHVAEMFSPLLKGITLLIVRDSEVLNIHRLIHLLISKQISRITLVPSLLRALIQVKRNKELDISSLQYIFCSGEDLSYQLADEFYTTFRKVVLVNIYGSTEVSADVTCYQLPENRDTRGYRSERTPIGKPIFNTKIIIVDKDNRLVPVGVPGEILVFGDAVTSGYLNDPELNERKIVQIPFFWNLAAYRSGDLGRWLPDGNIEFLGRLDYQVKIRGFRISLGEIERALAAHEQITGAVVIAGGKDADEYLACYYLSENEIKIAELRNYLSGKLPGYMIPSSYTWLPGFPLTPSGKLDRKALPEPVFKTGDNHLAPSNELEERLAEIWAGVLKLGKEQISVNASFFELGGHSLRAMTLVNKIQGELGLEISIKDVFERKDILSLSKLLRSSKRSGHTKLKRAEKREYYNLSIAQKRLYYFYELDRSSLTFNLPAVARLKGALDKKKLFGVFTRLIERHEALHTSITIINEQPVQFISKDFVFEIEYFHSAENEVESIVKRFIRPFDLSRAPLFRVGLIETDPDIHFLMVDMHHIISDGTSVGLLINDLMLLYSDIELPPLELDYKDYAVWQQSTPYQEKIAGKKDFWVKEFSEPIIPLDVPVDFVKPLNTEGDFIRFDLSPGETRQLRSIAEKEVATISMVILSVLSILLSKISGQEDIVIGMAVAGREQYELESMIGMFPVVLPLRTYPQSDLGFRDFLTSLKSTFLSTFDNQSYQYEDLAKELNIERHTGRNPWFDVMYLYQNFEISELSLPGLTISPYKEQNIVAHEKLNLTVKEDEDQISFRLVYSTALFTKQTIERFVRYFRKVVEAILTDVNVRIADIGLITDQEKRALLNTENTKKEIDRGSTFSDLFKDQVKKTPLNIAVEHNGSRLTYKELYDKSMRLAAYLLSSHAGLNRNIALFLPRGIEMLTGIIATFHFGGAYIPIDMDFPVQRMMEILADSGSEIVITIPEAMESIREIGRTVPGIQEIICFDQLEQTGFSTGLVAEKTTDDLAYIIYTSGTTGKPKGVMIHQMGMINHLYAIIDVLGLNEKDAVAQTASPCFDISVWQFLAPLLAGGKVYIIDKDKLQEPGRLLEELRRGEVTIFQSVPSLLRVFLDEWPQDNGFALTRLRWMIPTGESLPVLLAKKWHSYCPGIQLLNAYGPAEASDDVTTYVVEAPMEGQFYIPIGKPIRNMQVYILDVSLHLCPVGVKGEICVAGLGVGKGYWKDEERTGRAFIPNPFRKDSDDPEYATLYMTGDMGYYLEDHNIVCTGRKDDQVKIRGARIEMQEIENRLVLHRSIPEVRVLAKEWAGNKYLIAYYVSEKEIAAAELENHLLQTLPSYMIPSFFVHVKRLPLTLNGKLDRRALPDPEIRSGSGYLPPTSRTESKLVDIWAEVLQLDNRKISVDESFFYIGGHSLNAITLINKIHKEFSIKILLKDFFMKPTVRFISEYIDASMWVKKEHDTQISGKTEVLL